MTPAALLMLGVFGLMVGSFLNVCIARIPAGESVVSPRSRCPRCRTAIAAYDNIPVVSWLLLGGTCRTCRAPISAVYPAVELVTALAFVGQGLVIGDHVPLLAVRLVFTAMLIVLFGTDMATMRLPNAITLPGIAIGIGASMFLSFLPASLAGAVSEAPRWVVLAARPPSVAASLAGAALGAALPWLIGWGWKKWKGVDAMGLGDVKMLAMIGAFLGWQQVWVVLFFGSLCGALVGIGLLAARRGSLSTMLPFGTYLAVAAYAASLFGPALVDWYLGLYQ